MNKTLRILFCCALALTVVSFAAAADHFNVGGLQGAKTDSGHAVLPATATVYSNCGTGCKSYDTGDGYFVSGTSGEGAGQTLAVSFTPTKSAKVSAVALAESCYAGGPCDKTTETVLQADSSTGPGKTIGKFTQTGKFQNWSNSSPLTFKSKKAVALKAKTKYWLCQAINPKDSGVTVAWMLSSSDTSSDFYFQDSGSCTSSSWNDADGDTRPAFDIE
jgi:hypothetical protein